MLLLSASDGVVVLQQRHSLLQGVGVWSVRLLAAVAGGASASFLVEDFALGLGEDLQLPGSLQVSSSFPDPALTGWSAGEIACKQRTSKGCQQPGSYAKTVSLFFTVQHHCSRMLLKGAASRSKSLNDHR